MGVYNSTSTFTLRVSLLFLFSKSCKSISSIPINHNHVSRSASSTEFKLETTDELISRRLAHILTYGSWKVQHGAQATSVPLTFIENLKENYPDHHVMQTNPDKCDLMGYADAGFAKSERSDEIANWTIQTYHAPGSRLANKPKTVVENVKFGMWVYVWEKMEYIVYQAQYDHPAGFGTLKLQFILTDKEKDPSAESISALILAASAWTVELHEEIYVFDSQEWVKDKSLYESVQGSSWDEVILDKIMKANLIADVEGFFDNQALYKKLAVPWKRGIILHGVPGENLQDTLLSHEYALHWKWCRFISLLSKHIFLFCISYLKSFLSRFLKKIPSCSSSLTPNSRQRQNYLHQSPHVKSLLSSFPYPIPLCQIFRR